MKKVFFMAVLFGIAISNSATSHPVAKAVNRNTVFSGLFTNPWVGVKSLKKASDYAYFEVYSYCSTGYQIDNITIGTDTYSLEGQFPILSCSHKSFQTDQTYGGSLWIYIPYVFDPTANHSIIVFDENGMQTVPVTSGGIYTITYVTLTKDATATIYAL